MKNCLFFLYQVFSGMSGQIRCWSVGLLLMVCMPLAHASPMPLSSVQTRSAEFQVPSQLRPRVNFWKDIYARYGKFQVVIHHRNFPQVVFKVLDLGVQGAELDPVSFERFKKREVESHVNEVRTALRHLQTGAGPSTALEERVEQEMRSVPGGLAKYKDALDDDLVRSQTGIKEKMKEAIERSSRYLPMIESIFVKDFGLPVELTRLPFVESSFDYTAYSSAGAAGIWQFMPRTAKGYMTVGAAVDERRDPVKSSAAAARYLMDAYRRLGTWPLAITSYNHGVGGVMKRVREAGTSDIASLIEHPTERPFGFASSNFFPCFLAALEVYDQRADFFPDVRLEPPLRLVEHRVAKPMSVSHVSRQIGIDVETLKRANYALLDRVWQGRSQIPAGYALKVPVEYADRLANLRVPESVTVSSDGGTTAPSASSIYGGISYKVRKGDTLSDLAKRYGVTVQQIEDLNGIRGRSLRVGQVLTIKPREGARPESTNEVPDKKDGRTISSAESSTTYVVKPGDSLWSISKRMGSNADEIRRLNKLGSSKLRVGQKLILAR